MKFKSTGDVLKDLIQINSYWIIDWTKQLETEMKRPKPNYGLIEALSDLIKENAVKIKSSIKKYQE